MKPGSLLMVHALLLIAAGIAFALYGPLMLNLYGVTSVQGGNDQLYWHIASFARLFGAALFLAGWLLFALRSAVEQGELGPASLRGVAFSLVMGDGILLAVALTQQASVWATWGGWATVAVLAVLLLAAGAWLARQHAQQPA